LKGHNFSRAEKQQEKRGCPILDAPLFLAARVGDDRPNLATCFVSGHDFSRAEKAPNSNRALAPEGPSSASPTQIHPSPKRVFRICRERFAPEAFSGEGARRFGGRWSSRGVPMVYCSSSLALAAIELFVHLEPNLQPDDLVSIAATLPASEPVQQLTQKTSRPTGGPTTSSLCATSATPGSETNPRWPFRSPQPPPLRMETSS